MSILLDGASRVLVQGISARQARAHLPYMLRYGTRVVAGVAPGRGGETVEYVPVYDTVAGACRNHEIDVSVLFVPAPGPAMRRSRRSSMASRWCRCSRKACRTTTRRTSSSAPRPKASA